MLLTCSFLLLSLGGGGPQLSLTSHPPKDTWILWVKLWGMFVYQLMDENKSFETNTQNCNPWVIWWVSAPFGFERNCQTFAERLPSPMSGWPLASTSSAAFAEPHRPCAQGIVSFPSPFPQRRCLSETRLDFLLITFNNCYYLNRKTFSFRKTLHRNWGLVKWRQKYTWFPSSFKPPPLLYFYHLTVNFYFYLKWVFTIRHTQPFLKSPQPSASPLKNECKLSQIGQKEL